MLAPMHMAPFLRAVIVAAALGACPCRAAAHDGPYRPLVPAASPGAFRDRLLPGAVTLDIDLRALGGMIDAGNVLDATLPMGANAEVLVELRRIDVLEPDATVVMVDAGGIERRITPTITLWQGVVAGDPDSKVFLGLSAEQSHGWIMSGGTMSVITTRHGGGRPVVAAYETSVLDGIDLSSTTSCAGTAIVPGDIAPPPTTVAPSYSSRVACKAFRVAIDSDQEFATRNGGALNAADYAVVLVAASNMLYTDEVGMGLRIGYLRTWAESDPWNESDASSQLGQLKSHWNSRMASVGRSSVHLLSGRQLGGGIAYLRAACNRDWGYAVSANLSGSFPFPLIDNSGSNWDVVVVSHEWGHVFGSEHTHDSSAYDPIIDGCGLRTGNNSCERGSQDCTTAAAGTGTIMSYCHSCSGGLRNVQLTFGRRVVNRMSPFLDSIGCGSQLNPPVLDSIARSPTGPLCEGTPVTLTAVASGTELRFQWFRNGVRVNGATERTHAINQPVDGDRWDVMVYSPCGTELTRGTSRGVTLAIASLPVITRQPAPVTTCLAGPVEVSIETSSRTDTLRWEVLNPQAPGGWQPLTDGPVMIRGQQVADASGTGSRTLVLTSLTAGWPATASIPARAVRGVVSSGCGDGAEVVSNGVRVSICLADFNCDGGVDGADIDEFFPLWEAGAPAADTNADGGIDGDDIGAFFASWEAGC